MAAEIHPRAERHRAMLARPQTASTCQSHFRRCRRSRPRHPWRCRPSQPRAATPFIAHSHTCCLIRVFFAAVIFGIMADEFTNRTDSLVESITGTKNYALHVSLIV